MSRHPLPTTFSPDGQIEEYINHIAQNAVPRTMNLEDLRKYTAEDATLQSLCTLIKCNTWDEIKHPELLPTTCDVNELKLFYNIQNELSVSQSLGHFAQQLGGDSQKAAPTSNQLAHHGHQGMVKTKQLLREKVWFPGIDNLVKTWLECCLPCQSVGPPNKPAPLYAVEIPKHSWDTVYVDFLGPFRNNFLLLVMIDGCTRYPEVDVLRNTSGSSTIRSKKRLQDMVYQIPLFRIMDLHSPAMSSNYTCKAIKSVIQR